MKGFSKLFSNNFGPIICGGLFIGSATAAGSIAYDYATNRDSYVNREGVAVYKQRLTQRERFDRFAESLHDASSSRENNTNNNEGGSASETKRGTTSSKNASTTEKEMTLEEFIASFLPGGVVPPAPKGEASSTPSSSSSASSSLVKTSDARFKALERLFKQLDIDGNGVLNFSEYCALFCFLSTDDDQIRTAFTMFDEDGSGSLDVKEFCYLMKALNPDPSAVLLSPASMAANHHKNKNNASSRSGTLLHSFFGPKLDAKLPFPKFDKVVRDLRAAVQEAEFEAADLWGKGELDATEIRSLVFGKRDDKTSSSPLSLPSSSSSSSDSFAEWEAARRAVLKSYYHEGDEHLTATKSTYQKFCEIIRNSDNIMQAMQLYVGNKKRIAASASNSEGEGEESGESDNTTTDNSGVGLDKEEFLRAVKIGIQGRVSLTPRELEVFFAVFDRNRNGCIEVAEFEELCRINKGFGAGYHRNFALPEITRLQQFQLCMMQRDRK